MLLYILWCFRLECDLFDNILLQYHEMHRLEKTTESIEFSVVDLLIYLLSKLEELNVREEQSET